MDGSIPVFVNEAAYMEKRIALSLTRREVWSVSTEWIAALEALMLNQPQAQVPFPS